MLMVMFNRVSNDGSTHDDGFTIIIKTVVMVMSGTLNGDDDEGNDDDDGDNDQC